MAEQINIKINLEAGQSQKAIRDLSKEIQDLTRKMLQTKTGTQAFTDLSNKIKQSRTELNNLKNALNNQEPVEVQVEVDTEQSINSISALQDRIEQLTEEIKGLEIGSDQFKKLTGEVSKANAKLRDTQKQLEGLDFNQTAGEMGKFAGGVSAGFTAITAVIGSGNEEFEAFTTNVIAGMAVANGLKGSLEAVSAAQLLLNSAMNANPMFKVVAVVGALVAGLTLLWKRQKDNEKAVREASVKQEEYNNKLRDSRNSILELSLSLAEYNKNIEDQIFLTNQIIENDFKNEVSEIGKEYGVVSGNLSVVNKELEEYNRLSQIIEQNSLEVNRLKQQETELTQEQIDRITELQDENNKNEKVRVAQLNRIQAIVKNYNETSTKMEIKSVELIANAFVKKEKTIKDSNERLVKDAKKTNDDLVENTQNAVKQLTKYRLDYYDNLIKREKEIEIQRAENQLQDMIDTNFILSEITKQRTKLSNLIIQQKQTEQRLLKRAQIEEQNELIKTTKENIKSLQEELLITKDKNKIQIQLNESNKKLKQEELELNNLIKDSSKKDAEEIKLLQEKLTRDNVDYVKGLINEQYQTLIRVRENNWNKNIEMSKRELAIIESDYEVRTKFLRDKLVSDRDMEISERESILNEIKSIENDYNTKRFIELQKILRNETEMRQKQAKISIMNDLNKFEGVFRQVSASSSRWAGKIGHNFDEYVFDSFKDNTTDLSGLIEEVIKTTEEYIENTIKPSLDETKSRIEQLAKLTDENSQKQLKDSQSQLIIDERMGQLLELRVRELKSIQKVHKETTEDIKNNERETAELQLVILEHEKKKIQLRLQDLQLQALQKQALMEISNIELERYEGNLVRFNEATKKQLKLRRDLELNSLETLKEQNLISVEDYEKSKENIEKVYRRRKIEADIEAYKKVFEFAKIGSDAMFQITSNQQNAIYENRNKQIQESFDKENEALTKSKENGLISEEEYNKQIEKINEEKAKKEKKIQYDKAKQEKEAALTKAAIENAINIIEATPNPAAVALAAFTGLTQLAVIRSQPLPQYERGGLLKGNRHAQGGIIVEAEDGEVILNRNVSKNPMMLQLASMMNEQTGGKRLTTTTFNSGMGITPQSEKIDLEKVVENVIKGVSKIPVVNVAVDTNRVVRKVQNLENKSKI